MRSRKYLRILHTREGGHLEPHPSVHPKKLHLSVLRRVDELKRSRLLPPTKISYLRMRRTKYIHTASSLSVSFPCNYFVYSLFFTSLLLPSRDSKICCLLNFSLSKHLNIELGLGFGTIDVIPVCLFLIPHISLLSNLVLCRDRTGRSYQ